MSRNNVTKVKLKKTINKSKNQKKATNSSSIRAMEKEFKNMPAKLIQQLRKDSKALKKQESVLNLLLKKMQKQKKSIDNKHTMLLTKFEDKHNPVAKKQLSVIKKSADKTNQHIAKLSSDISKIKNQLITLSEKQAQFTYISKEIAGLKKQSKIQPPIKPRKKIQSEVQPTFTQDTSQTVQELIDFTEPQTEELES